MNKDIKFTTDGKKVIVIGSLNSQEKIVQEIFIVDGSEIPSGEHFVVKSLHDAPAVSWKENDLKKLEERYERERKQYNAEIDKNYKQYKEKTQEFRLKFQYIASALKNADEKSFELLCDFICGDIKFIVVNQYNPEILTMDQFKQMYEDRLRLFSLFGKDDGTFTYAVNQYYDYSGSHTFFYPYKNYDDALGKLKEILFSKKVSVEGLKTAEKYNIKYPTEMVNVYKDEIIKQISGNIENYMKQISQWSETLENTKNL